jgi:uncharacterized protein DUF3303
MKYVITWSAPTATYVPAIKKFLANGGLPPAGVKMLGRYHALAGSSSGFILAETSDHKAIFTWLAEWMDTVSFDVTPVVEDADAAPILQAVKR